MAEHKKHNYECGICGEMNKHSDVVHDDGSDTGWICLECLYILHPEYEEFGED